MTRIPAGGPRTPAAVFGLLCLLLMPIAVLSSGPVAAQDDSTGEQDVLHLTERPFQDGTDRWNFTVFPADENESGVQRQAEQRPFPNFRADWTWYLQTRFANWTIDRGSTWQLHLFISGLDEVHPVPTLSSLASGHAGHEIRADVRKGDEVVTEGVTEVQLVDVEPGVQMYTLELPFDDAVAFNVEDNVPSLLFEISFSGRGTEPESPLHMHFGSLAAPSRLIAPDYPVDGFRVMELEYLLEKECRELILQQRSCEDLQRQYEDPDDNDPPDEDDPGDPEEEDDGEGEQEETDGDQRKTTPGPDLFLLLSGLVAYLLIRGRRGP